MDNPFAPSPRKSAATPPAEKSEKPAVESVPEETAPPTDPSGPIPPKESQETSAAPEEERPPVPEVPATEQADPIAEAPAELEVSQDATAPIAEVAVDSANDDSPPPLDLEEVSCRSCRFFHIPEGHTRMDVVVGECRCKAPSPGINAKATWPSVDWGSWCGEWDQGISDDDMVRLARNVAESMSE